jgi:glycosyltransferase involved in cell wall biosynthesis
MSSDARPGTAHSSAFAGPLVLINYFPTPSGWRYATLVSGIAGVRSQLFTVRMGNLDYGALRELNQRAYGLDFRPRRISQVANYLFAKWILRDVTREIARTSREGGVTHFLQEEIRPWVRPPRSVVSIHANPIGVLETDRYYSYGLGYKITYRRHLSAYSKFARPIVESNYVKRGLEAYGFEGAPLVVPPPVAEYFHPRPDRPFLRSKFGIPSNRTVVLSVSSGERRKNLSVLPAVFDRLPKEWLLVRVGPPVRGALTLPHLTDGLLGELYNASDVLLFPTLEEGFGYPVIEAFASGLPVVTSDLEVMREVASDAAILVDPNDPAALARAVQDAVRETGDLTQRGLRQAKLYTLEAFGERMRAAYSTVS